MATPILQLQELFANQAGSDVFLLINQALRDLEIFAAGSIKSRSLTAPPNNPTEGDLYIPVATATGDWAGLENKVVQWRNGIWEFFTPFVGMTITSIPDEGKLYWDGSTWKAGSGATTNIPTETWNTSQTYYVNTIAGDDNNNGLTTNTPLRTVNKALSIISTKRIEQANLTVIRIAGLVIEKIDCSKIWAEKAVPWIDGGAWLLFSAWQGQYWEYQGSGEFLIPSPDPKVLTYFESCHFLAEEDSLQIYYAQSYLQFLECTFDTGSGNNNSCVHLQGCRMAKFEGYDLGNNERSSVFNNTGGNSSEALTFSGNGALYLDGTRFNDYPYGVGIYDGARCYNWNESNFFNATGYSWDLWNDGQLFTDYPADVWNSIVDRRFAQIHFNDDGQSLFSKEWFFPSLSVGTQILILNQKFRTKIYSISIKADGNASFQLDINGTTVPPIISLTNQEASILYNPEPQLFTGDRLSLVVSNLPATNIVIQIDFLKF